MRARQKGKTKNQRNESSSSGRSVGEQVKAVFPCARPSAMMPDPTNRGQQEKCAERFSSKPFL